MLFRVLEYHTLIIVFGPVSSRSLPETNFYTFSLVTSKDQCCILSWECKPRPRYALLSPLHYRGCI